MKQKLTSALLLLVMLGSLLLQGCSADTVLNDYLKMDPPQLNSSSQAQQSSETGERSSQNSSQGNSKSSSKAAVTYTMADIKKLNNTKYFAKKTLEHIFDGTINSKGKATGYHYSMVSDSKGKIIDGTRSDTDKHGVFTGKVTVNNVKKNGFSSFYPESWTPQQVVDAINTAYNDALDNSRNTSGDLWVGYCDDGLEIDMYLNDDRKITTAYPVYEGE